MKKILTLLVFVTLGVTAAFANGNDISKNALTTFSAAFAKASNVKWAKENNYYTASFQMNGQSFNALLSEEGEMIAVSRNILSTDLPVGLQVSLNTTFPAYWISELVEYAVDNETRYFITIENANQKITLENVGTYDWSSVKRTAK